MRRLAPAEFFQQIHEARNVAADVELRILQRIAHARLRRQMNHGMKLRAAHQRSHRRAIGQVAFHKAKIRLRRQQPQPGGLQPIVLIRIEIVEAEHPPSPVEQAFGGVKSNESGAARHQDMLVAAGSRLSFTRHL